MEVAEQQRAKAAKHDVAGGSLGPAVVGPGPKYPRSDTHASFTPHAPADSPSTEVGATKHMPVACAAIADSRL
jgi:hypothetical protein